MITLTRRVLLAGVALLAKPQPMPSPGRSGR